jgi:NADP-dependent 3-hydroxy acid dehydrogenase YdfG
MAKPLTGKVALVTGGSRGVGAASGAAFVTGTVLNVDGGFGA